MFLSLIYPSNSPLYQHICRTTQGAERCLRRAIIYLVCSGNGAGSLPEHDVNDLNAQIQELLLFNFKRQGGRAAPSMLSGSFVSAFIAPPPPRPILSFPFFYKVVLPHRCFMPYSFFFSSPSVRYFSTISSVQLHYLHDLTFFL